MHPMKFCVVTLILIVKICWGGIVVKNSHSKESFQLIDAVIDIVECYYENAGKAVGLAGHMPDIFNRKLSEKLVPVTLLNGYRTKVYKSRLYRWETHRLNVFVLTATSSKRFYETIHMTESSKWWDRTAHHLIVNWSTAEKDGCFDSKKYLIKAWENKMINARVICQNRTGGVKLYGYNPYTTQARVSWNLEKTYSSKGSHPISVFSRDYLNADKICETVGADKVKNLAGYPFCINKQYNGAATYDPRHKSWSVHSMENLNVVKILISTLNATVVYRYWPSNSSRSEVYRDRDTCMGIRRDPIGLFANPRLKWSHGMYSYPIHKNEILATTKFRGHLTQLQKILSVTDVNSRIGLCVILLLTLLFFKFVVRHSVAASFLNVIRIVCNTGFANMPNNLPARLYIAAILLVAVVMQGIYQGDVAALLTQTIPIRDAMTSRDLVDMDYTIFVTHWFMPLLFADPMFNGHVAEVKRGTNVIRVLLERPMTAVVDQEYHIKDVAWALKLHVVGQPLGILDTAFRFPLITHLEERLNVVLLRMREADITVPMYLRGLDRSVSEFEFDQEVQKNQDYKNMTLRDLEFAFVILGIGLTCASITFLAELAFIKRSRTRSTRIQFLN